mmetsp:Transcript_57018/g.180461  ORF Transcript_57018/g.180461 Transcript_57018/m.180461 type:complete len:225 (-) Transcript_57018:100-774(-)
MHVMLLAGTVACQRLSESWVKLVDGTGKQPTERVGMAGADVVIETRSVELAEAGRPLSVLKVRAVSSGYTESKTTGDGSVAVAGNAEKTAMLPVTSMRVATQGSADPLTRAEVSGTSAARFTEDDHTSSPSTERSMPWGASRGEVSPLDPARARAGAKTTSSVVRIVFTVSSGPANLSTLPLEIMKRSVSTGGVLSTTTGTGTGGYDGDAARFPTRSAMGPKAS